MTTFPSVEWFEVLGQRAAAHRELYRKLGYVDANIGIRIDANGKAGRGYVVGFGGYQVREVHAAPDPEAEADFTIQGPLDAWKAMIEDIQAHGEAGLDYTLNRLTMAGVPLRVVGKDQGQVDLFYRVNQTLQALFNEACGVATEFAAA